ncbi:MAG: hypothetical protein HN348_02340 [Proteobacteria bacterium]|jgi:hypothetical protein|nr:hypothetical protein [Pseudomonadota bacterium]
MTDKDSSKTGIPWYSSIKSWLILLAVTVLFWAGGRIPLPGLDRALLGPLDLAVPSIFMLGTSTLLGIRLATMLFIPAHAPDRTVRVLHKAALALYLSISVVQGTVMALALEQMVLGHAGLVAEPGWTFRVVTVITLCAVAALLWWMADRISSTKLVNGALWLFALSTMQAGLVQLTSPSLYWEPNVTATLGATAIFFPLAIVAIGLALFRPDWPTPVARQVVALSPIDLLCLPLVGSSTALVLQPLYFVISDETYIAVEAVAATGLAFCAVLWLYLKHESRGSPAWIGLAILATVPPMVTAGIWGILTARDLLEPGPLAGPTQLELAGALNNATTATWSLESTKIIE